MKCARAALVGASLALSLALPAAADLDQDVKRLSAGWLRHGRVTRLAPRLAERGTPSLIFAPPVVPPAERRPRAKCLTLAVIGPSSTHFVVRSLGVSPGPGAAGENLQVSIAGLVELTRCDAERAELGALLIEMRSPRAVLEALVVESEAPLPRATLVLPQRDPGPVDVLSLRETRLPSPPMAARVAAAENRLRREGGAEIESSREKVHGDGSGTSLRSLAPGCHRFELMADAGGPGWDTELALSTRIEGPARLVSSESGDGSQLAVSVCAGAEAGVRLDFSGARPGSELTVMRARRPLPHGLPDAWSPIARAGVAAILLRHNSRVSAFPVNQGLGIQGPTLLPEEVEAGACYLAVVTAISGESAGLSLAAVAPGVAAQNRSDTESDGTLVSFCTTSGNRALLEVDSRGRGLIWLYALFQNGRTELGTERSP